MVYRSWACTFFFFICTCTSVHQNSLSFLPVGCECWGSWPSLPGQDVGHVEADWSARDGGWLVPLSPWLWLLALWCGHQYPAELWGSVIQGCGSGRWSYTECQRSASEGSAVSYIFSVACTFCRLEVGFRNFGYGWQGRGAQSWDVEIHVLCGHSSCMFCACTV